MVITWRAGRETRSSQACRAMVSLRPGSPRGRQRSSPKWIHHRSQSAVMVASWRYSASGVRPPASTRWKRPRRAMACSASSIKSRAATRVSSSASWRCQLQGCSGVMSYLVAPLVFGAVKQPVGRGGPPAAGGIAVDGFGALAPQVENGVHDSPGPLDLVKANEQAAVSLDDVQQQGLVGVRKGFVLGAAGGDEPAGAGVHLQPGLLAVEFDVSGLVGLDGEHDR